MTSLLPETYKDKRNLALEKCIIEALKIDLKNFIKYPVDLIDDKFLSILAEEFHIQGFEGFNFAMSRAQKINLIKTSHTIHKLKGTKNSIINALKNLDIEAGIKEIETRPGHFSIEFLNLKNRSLTEVFEEEIRGLINHFKPLTRVLDVINIFLTTENAKFYTGARFKALETVTISTKGASL